MFEEIISLPIWALITIPVSIYVLSTVFLAIIDPLRHIPGPFLARFTRLWYCWKIYEGDYERTNQQLHTRYGPIVRISPHEYSIDDVDAAKVIYSIGGGVFPKTPWYLTWQPPHQSVNGLFSDLDPHSHSQHRRKVANYYSMSFMVHWLQCYAFDVIGEITFGKRFGFLDKGEDKDGVWIHDYLFPLLPSNGGFGFVVKFAANRIAEKEKVLKEQKIGDRKEEGTQDFVTRILMACEKDPEKITKGHLSITCQSNVGAGSDTTAITLSSILYHLLKYPHTYQELRDEIETAAKEGRISDPITFKEAQGLPYLQAVLKEGLRVHPAVGLGLQRIVPAGGTTIANQFIPAGSVVGINAYVAHKNTSVWGLDADQWRPERWLEIEEQGRGAEVEKYFFSFGMGSRTCIGKNISLLEINKLIPQLVRRFDFELDSDVERNGGIVCNNRWFVKQQNFRAKVLAKRDGKIE
ncbi:hypothetical protein EAE96_001727 [Botrytis aclada]|nr:hypothetical protein EAE96_001727 [Botrytis aclada]